ncbi:hypothetical protein LINPERPRIM_LOCUS4997 [Linum perenne]
MASTGDCSRCGKDAESVIHTLRDYDFATAVWSQLGLNVVTKQWWQDQSCASWIDQAIKDVDSSKLRLLGNRDHMMG